MEASSLDPLFAELRPQLVRAAYRMMGTLTDAEEAVQETYVRLRGAAVDAPEHPERYLTRAVVHQCLDRWKSAKARRETYVGPWLPEPLVDEPIHDPAAPVELHESLSMAFLVLLESLTPVERAVFLMHDVFGYEYDEVAEAVGKTPVHCRQIAKRAREELQRRRPRFERDLRRHEQLLDQFVAACRTGDVGRLQASLAEDVELTSDGGGKVPAARVPLLGRPRVMRLLLGLTSKYAREGVAVSLEPRPINGRAGAVLFVGGMPSAALSLDTADGLIRKLFIVSNPEKTASLRGRVPAAGGSEPRAHAR